MSKKISTDGTIQFVISLHVCRKSRDEMKGHEQLEDIYLTCVICGSDFRHAVDEQIVFLQKGFLHNPSVAGRVKRCGGRARRWIASKVS